MIINIKKAMEICKVISDKKIEYVTTNAELLEKVMKVNYEIFEEDKYSDWLNYQLGLEAVGLEDIETIYNLTSADDIFSISPDELDEIDVTTKEGNQCISLLKWLYILENGDSYRITIDSEIEGVKKRLKESLTLCIDIKSFIKA